MFNEFWKRHLKTFILGFGILVLAFFLRVKNLTILPVFNDEAIYIRWAQIMKNEPTLRFLPLSDGKQPLFMWSMIPLFKVFSDPLVAGRTLSVLTGLVSLASVFILTFILFRSTNKALIASSMYALSPFALFFDRLALVDSMLTMFGILSVIFAILAVKKVRLDCAMLSGFFLGGALLTKSPGIFFALLLPSTLILSDWPKNVKKSFNKLSVFVFLFTFTYLIAFGLYNILRLGPNFHMIAIRNKDYVFPLSHIWENPKDPFIFHINEIVQWLWFLGPSFLIFMLIIGVIRGFNSFKKETLVMFIFAFFPLFVNAMYAKVFTARYILYTLPFIFILASLFFSETKEKKAPTFYLEIFLFVAFIAHAFWMDFLLLSNVQKAPLPRSERSGYLEEWSSGYGIKEVADFLREIQEENPNQKIVVGTEGYFGVLPDGLKMYLEDLPEITVVGVGLDLKEIPLSLVESEKSGNRTFLVINKSRLKADFRDLNLNLISSYPKALRSEGTREYNLLGPQEVLYLFELKDIKK